MNAALSVGLRARNGCAVPTAEIPCLPVEEFRSAVLAHVAAGRRVAALYAAPEGEALRAVAVLAEDAESALYLLAARLEGSAFPSLTPACPQVHLFEREMAEQYGIRPEGHPWMKPVRFHRSWRPGWDAWGRAPGEEIRVGVMDFYRVEGDEVHEVAVGPVHAGIIEPGHFRFQCHGEEVFHLEISLGYQHRGVERALVGGPTRRTLHYMETLAGDTTVGHTSAYGAVLEALAGCRVPARALALRGIALELERLANHVGDLGALAGDVAYLPTASFCGRLRGDFLNLTALLCGNRFGRGLVRPGGVDFDLEAARAPEFLRRLDAAERDVRNAVELLWDTPSVMARFEGTGPVPAPVARELGVVGPAARASGLARDVRYDHPWGIFQYAHVPVATWETGDVFARAFVRWLEIQHSIVFVREQVRALPQGALKADLGPLAAGRTAVSLVEGWRGEICHVASTDASGRLARYKVVDPSFHNWTALAVALRNQQISDFPLCNKSFNLSYCGHDL